MITALLTLFGGLGIFFLGMKLMSEGLQKISGNKLRQALEALTKKPIMGILLGAGITAFIQSSSVTTVMAVGFVNAGMLTLTQAIGIMLGANIGTTLTAWIVAFTPVIKISLAAMPLIGSGVFLINFSKSKKTQFKGEIILGLGLIFFGLLIMKDSLSPLQENENIKNALLTFGKYPIWGVLIGAIITAVFQSSSATLALIQTLAWQGLIDFDSSLGLLLGSNIGTTITALIGSIGANTWAKRAAMANFISKIFGSGYMLIFTYLGLFAFAVEKIIPGEITNSNIMIHIAGAHTIFNIFNALLFLPFIKLLEKISIKLIPENEIKTKQETYLNPALLSTPNLALQQTQKEIVHMGEIANKAVKNSIECFLYKSKKTPKNYNQVKKEERATDQFQRNITFYLIQLSERVLLYSEAEKIPALIHSINDMEKIGDYAENIVDNAYKKSKIKIKNSEKIDLEIKKISEEIDNMFSNTLKALNKDDDDYARQSINLSTEIHKLCEKIRTGNTNCFNKTSYHEELRLLYLDVIFNLEKISDHLENINLSLLRGFRWEKNKNK